MKKIFQLIPFILVLLFATSAQAATILLTFEGLQDKESINNYYDGDYGSKGSGPGPDYGIIFTSTSQGLIQRPPGHGNFIDAPSMPTVMWFPSMGIVLDMPGGFSNQVSLFYSCQYGKTGIVKIFEDLNSTGSVLTEIILPATHDHTVLIYDTWLPIVLNFSGTAHSLYLGGEANFIAFDNINLTPIPGTLVLLGTGLISLTGIRLRRRFNS